MSLLTNLAPLHSRRRLILKIVRDFIYHPSSLLGHLSATNFHNAAVSARLRIHCTVCSTDGGVTYDYPDTRLRKAHGIGVLRETLCCRKCGASMRDRQMAVGLLTAVEERTGQRHPDLVSWRTTGNHSLRILDTDSFSALNKILRGMPGYSHSQYSPGMANGAVLPDGSLNVDLLHMPFADGSFDIVMTSDVMEHIADDVRAHQEIFRSLAPKGTYVFTIPYDGTMLGTRRLTQPSGSSIHFIIERHVHGDPHSVSGILAHRIYGQEIFSDLCAMGYKVKFLSLEKPAEGIFGGDLFLAGKSS